MTSIWANSEMQGSVQLIDQRYLPHQIVVETISTLDEMAKAIEEMHVRGAPLIGVSAAWGIAIAAFHAQEGEWRMQLEQGLERLARTRPTAVNLFWALDRQRNILAGAQSLEGAKKSLWNEAIQIQKDDVAICHRIGNSGLVLLQDIFAEKRAKDQNAVVNILTHCNAGWLACVDYGTATAPMYLAHQAGIPIHVWVDETRPRNQGAKLTAWELGQHGIKHTLIPDNAGGHLMQHGMVDIVITGADRVTANGDAANKIGTYLKALAAKDNGVPFYIAMPESTIDWTLSDGVRGIPIETRSEHEVRYMDGLDCNGLPHEILICPEGTQAVNYGFDVTPARLISGFITEQGLCEASRNGLANLFGRES